MLRRFSFSSFLCRKSTNASLKGNIKFLSSSFFSSPEWSVSKFLDNKKMKTVPHKNLIQHLAESSHLTIKPEEIPLFEKDIQSILGFIQHVENFSSSTQLGKQLETNTRVLIEDTSKEIEEFPVEEILKNAPVKERTFFAVPKIKE